MRKRGSVIQGTDPWLIGIYAMLVCLGWMNIYAATYDPETGFFWSWDNIYIKQLLWIGLALFLILPILMTDGRVIRRMAYPVYGIAILLLVLVLVVGTEIKGARSWFDLGLGIRLQPSEFAKVAATLAIAALLGGMKRRRGRVPINTYFKAAAIILLPAALIILQPDAGSALIYIAFVFVLYREGLSGNFLLIGLYFITLFVLSILLKSTALNLPFGFQLTGQYVMITILVLLGAVVSLVLRRIRKMWLAVAMAVLISAGFILSVNFVFDHVLSQRHRDRINVTLGIVSDPNGAGYNVHQSKIAIGSGGFSGKGFLQGTQTKFDFVPEQQTDFIFCTIGEEWGFVGSAIFVLLYVFFLIRIIIIAERQRSVFTRVYAYGVAAIFFFHFLINIGMTVGLAPVIGVPLPFFSYGGSSLWAFTILLFILIRLDSERMDSLQEII